MKEMVVVAFDVRDNRRLYRVARELGNFGVRVQKSIFECHLDQDQLAELQKRLAGWIDAGQDQVRYYFLCARDVDMISIDGVGTVTFDQEYTMV